jgi:hypothetical protein
MYYTSQLIDGWLSRESNTYQYLKIDLEGLWEINSIDFYNCIIPLGTDMLGKWFCDLPTMTT